MRSPVVAIFKGVTLLILLVGIGAAGFAAYKRLPGIMEELAPRDKGREIASGAEITVEIPKGASLSKVGAILEDQGVVSSRFVFKVVALIRGEQRSVQAGEYVLKTGSDAGDVLDLLISGKTMMRAFTVPEGYDCIQTADLFQQSGLMSRQDFLAAIKDTSVIKEFGLEGDSLEGYLFPDTYFLRPSEYVDGKKVIRRMVKRFREVYDKHVRSEAEKSGWTMIQTVTLASLIEKEAKASEHGLVSSVFHNRLRKGMKLQSDPTVIYGRKPMGSRITRADLTSDHPYNTYVNKGLPPGPIANPGKDSLTAAVKPVDAEYLFFVAKNDGTHQFSKTLKEHNHWVNLYQRSSTARGEE
ncbi:MAG: endolytic transglycosylase MltG [Pseudomonadota bacterium]